jgi:hypothetical protein
MSTCHLPAGVLRLVDRLRRIRTEHDPTTAADK